MEIETENKSTEERVPYEVGRSDILPTISGNQLTIGFVKEIIDGAASTSMFGGGGKNKIAVMTYDGKALLYKPTDLMTGEESDENSMLSIDSITEGMKQSAKDKIVGTIMKSKGIIANAEDPAEAKQYFTDADFTQIKTVHAEMLSQLEAMKVSVEMKGNIAEHYMFRKHILLKGQKGQGKTYQIDKLLRTQSIETEYIAGHEGIEAIDLQGYLIKDDTGNLIWKDGVVTAAFRKATQGKKCAIFIDEMLRIPKRELNFLVGILTPDSEGFFNLRTGRVSHTVDFTGQDGKIHQVAEEEILRVKQDMIWAVGTTNAGAGYAVDNIDEALADRFRTIIVSMSDKEMKNILVKRATDKGFSMKLAGQLMDFYKNYNSLRDSGELTKTTSIRHLTEVIDLADNEDMVAIMLRHLIPTLCEEDTNGEPNSSQESIIEELIENALG